MIYNLRDIANAYYSKTDEARSLAYCRRALSLATKKDSFRSFATEIRCLIVANLCDLQRYHQAEPYMRLILADTAAAATPAVLTTAASYYNGIHDLARCRQVCLKLMKAGNLLDRQKAARILADIYMEEHNCQLALNAMKTFSICTDSINKQRKTETLMRMNALYNYGQKEKENMRLKADKNLYRGLSGIAIVLVIAAFIVLVLVIRYNRQQKALMKLKIDHYEDLRNTWEHKKEEDKQSETQQIEQSSAYIHLRRNIHSPAGPNRLHEEEWGGTRRSR